MIKIQVPATSANLGPGFDSLGLSLNMYNNIWIKEYDTIDIVSKDKVIVPKDKTNLIYWSANYLYKKCGRKLPGLKIRQENNIPMARGLGSSSACIVAGLIAANKFLGDQFSKQELINIAAKVEGHPDNIAPAFLGGLVSCAIENDIVYNVSIPINDNIRFAVFIPPFEIKTSLARKSLPTSYSKEDAIFNLSRSSLLIASLISGKLENLKVATQDRLHQPYRKKFINGIDNVFETAYELGAYGTYITGAGPSIIAIIDKKNENLIKNNAIKILEEKRILGWNLELLKPDLFGVSIH